MLNTSIRLGSNSQTVTFNQVSTGMMQRSNSNSIFIRFSKNSDMEKALFPTNGKKSYMHQFNYSNDNYEKYGETNGKIEVVVLQILIFGDDQFLCEVLETKFLQEVQK